MVGEIRVEWNRGRLKHSDFLENHGRLSRQISSLRSARKTDQPREISCNDVPPFKCYPPNLFSRKKKFRFSHFTNHSKVKMQINRLNRKNRPALAGQNSSAHNFLIQCKSPAGTHFSNYTGTHRVPAIDLFIRFIYE